MKDKSKSRSRQGRRKRGQKVCTAIKVPRDYPWKILGWLADDLSQFLNDDEQWLIKHVVRTRDFETLDTLSEAWGLQSIDPGDTDIGAIRARYQLSSLLKKFRFATDRKARELAAKEKFLACEEACYQYNHEGYKRLVNETEPWAIDAFTYAREFLRKLLGDKKPSHKAMTLWSRHGPGASLGCVSGQESTYYKYSNWPYTCTIDALRYARFAIETDERWFGALQNSYRRKFGIPKQMPLDMKLFWSRVIEVVDGNRITFVPKNAKIERSIAIEPTLNLYLQLGVDGYIRRRLKRWGVDLDDQSKNQELARLGSLRSNGFVTLDLAGASDSIALRLCKELLPCEWYSYLIDLRSPYGALGEDVLEYQKISSMGNGFTFALESAIFTACIYGVSKATKGCYNRDEAAVFGDDLIVVSDLANRLVTFLNHCGFAVNTDKSFLKDNFVRESCGCDWFHGFPLRPVFFSETPTTVMGLFVDRNRLQRILSLRWGLEESKTISQMDKWIPETCKRYFGPPSDEEFDSYRHEACYPKGGWRNSLWRYKRLIITPVPLKGPDFHMRKLMAPLRGSSGEKALPRIASPGLLGQVEKLFGLVPAAIEKWSAQRVVSGKGGIFTVSTRNRLRVSESFSTADFWRSEYAEVVPGPRPASKM